MNRETAEISHLSSFVLCMSAIRGILLRRLEKPSSFSLVFRMEKEVLKC